jgi:tetratricopeptide (TPR) repeat protein
MSQKVKARPRQELATPPLSALARGTPELGACIQARRWADALAPGLIALVTIAAFLPALENQFVNWDDNENLTDNPHYRGLGWPQLRWMWTAFHAGHYMPLTWMSFGLDYLLWGMQPIGYHLSSLLLHTANAVVFYFLARRLLGLVLANPAERGQAGLTLSAGFAALLFALHPLRVESVVWATERRDVLSGFFYLLTVLAYLRACGGEERCRWWYAGSVALFVCALLSKSMAVSLPVVLLILDVYPLRRLGGTRGWWGEAARRVYLEKIPFVLLALAASAIAFLALAGLQNMSSLDDLSVLGRLAVSAYGLSFYLWKTVAPVNLSPLYELTVVNPSAIPFLLSYGVVLTVTALAWTVRRRVPGLPATWLAYVVILLPVLGLFQNGAQIAADRYTYLAGLGWAILTGAGLFAFWSRLPSVLIGTTICVLLGFAALTWTQTHVWRNSQTLWTHALAIDPNSPLAEYGLGDALARQGKLAEAIEHFRRALAMMPDFAEGQYNWGHALAQQGRLAEAIERYREALAIRPDYPEAHYNWGHALAQQGRLAEAIEHYREALRIRPAYVMALNNLGNALARQGKPAEAIEQYRKALQIQPGHAEVHYNLGVTLAQQGKFGEAIEHYRRAFELRPDDAEVLNHWGYALARQGKPAEAIEQYQRALSIKPDLAEAHMTLGMALAQQGRVAEAIERYQQALTIRPNFADAHYNWGHALTQQGKPAEAIEHYREALRIQPGHAEAHYNWGVLLAQQGRVAEAIEHYRQALAIRPDFADAHYNWGQALAQQGKRLEAAEHFQRALSIRTNTTSNP